MTMRHIGTVRGAGNAPVTQKIKILTKTAGLRNAKACGEQRLSSAVPTGPHIICTTCHFDVDSDQLRILVAGRPPLQSQSSVDRQATLSHRPGLSPLLRSASSPRCRKCAYKL